MRFRVFNLSIIYVGLFIIPIIKLLWSPNFFSLQFFIFLANTVQQTYWFPNQVLFYFGFGKTKIECLKLKW